MTLKTARLHSSCSTRPTRLDDEQQQHRRREGIVDMQTLNALPIPRVALRRALRADERPAWQIAYMVGISPSRLSLVASGRREPSPGERERLALALGVSVRELFRRGPTSDHQAV
jgi:Helix-turn-helix